jgi:hypothetical protein
MIIENAPNPVVVAARGVRVQVQQQPQFPEGVLRFRVSGVGWDPVITYDGVLRTVRMPTVAARPRAFAGG